MTDLGLLRPHRQNCKSVISKRLKSAPNGRSRSPAGVSDFCCEFELIGGVDEEEVEEVREDAERLRHCMEVLAWRPSE